MFKRMRKSFAKSDGVLETKPGVLNFPKERQSQSQAQPLPAGRSPRFKSFLDEQRISSRPITIIRATDSDILHFREESYETVKREKDEYMAIPILPADEMDTLTSEIKVWRKTRRYFVTVYVIVQLLSLSSVAVTLFFALYWYKEEKPGFPGKYGVGVIGSNAFSVHMVLQNLNVFLLTTVAMIFRLAPNTRMRKIILIHVLVGLLAVSCFAGGCYFAIKFQAIYTKTNSHFYSIHGWIALIATFMYLVTILTGLLFLCYPTQWLRKCHSPAAMTLLMLCTLGMISGSFMRGLAQIGKDYVHGSIPSILINVFGVLLLFIFVAVRWTISDFTFRRRPRPQWDVIVYRNMDAIEEAFLQENKNFSNFEHFIRQINHVRLRALRLPRQSIRVSVASRTSRTSRT